MANYVAKVLKIRPQEILDYWGVAELIVTYGHYANKESYRNFLEWQSLDIKTKNEISKKPDFEQPMPYAVRFLSSDDDLTDEVVN